MTMTVYYKMNVSEGFTKVTKTGKADKLMTWKEKYEKDFRNGRLAALQVEYEYEEEDK